MSSTLLRQKLRYIDGQQTVKVGDKAVLSTGLEEVVIMGFTRDFNRPGSTGKIYVAPVEKDISMHRSYFPSVAGMEIVFIDIDTGKEVSYK